MAQTPERAAYLAMQRALRAMCDVEGFSTGTLASKQALLMDEWVKKYPGADGKKGG